MGNCVSGASGADANVHVGSAARGGGKADACSSPAQKEAKPELVKREDSAKALEAVEAGKPFQVSRRSPSNHCQGGPRGAAAASCDEPRPAMITAKIFAV